MKDAPCGHPNRDGLSQRQVQPSRSPNFRRRCGVHSSHGTLFRKTHAAPIRDDPSIQVRSLRFLRGMTAPAILFMEFALNKVIAHFCNSHWQMTSLEGIRVEFTQQSQDCFASRIRIGVLANCSDHPLAVDAFPVRSFVRPTELPHIWTAFTNTPK
jgi:hypothetical protein